MDIKETGKKLKPFAPVLSVALVTACVAGKGLRIIPFMTNLKEVKPTSTLFYRQQHNHFTATATMEYRPKTEKEFAGITCYQSEKYHYVFGVTKKEKDCYLILERTEKGQTTVLGEMKMETEQPVTLQVTGKGDQKPLKL